MHAVAAILGGVAFTWPGLVLFLRSRAGILLVAYLTRRPRTNEELVRLLEASRARGREVAESDSRAA
ncbi:MAG: hypothetical protein JWP11_3337 [Frankiales bacterium]|nr:hypothetical protein [Frankiales bacterium]